MYIIKKKHCCKRYSQLILLIKYNVIVVIIVLPERAAEIFSIDNKEKRLGEFNTQKDISKLRKAESSSE